LIIPHKKILITMNNLLEQIINYLNEIEKNYTSTSQSVRYKPQYFYFVYDPEQNQLKRASSEATELLRKELKEKRNELRKVVDAENFEQAVIIQKEVVELNNKLEESIKKDNERHEMNKTAEEMLKDLNMKLMKLVEEEKYEEAAILRDKIKSISQ